MNDRRLLLCAPRGFCAGVNRAIETIDRLLRATSETVYVRKQIVHNRFVVESFERRGVVFVDDVEDVPEGALVVLSAHGISPDVRSRAKALGQRIVDATCPLVTKVHREVQAFVRDGYSVLLVGHGGHEEVEGTMGQVPGAVSLVQDVEDVRSAVVSDPQRVAVVTQTTLSVAETRDVVGALKRRFPALREPPKGDICYATESRQAAVRALAAISQAIIVVGSSNSSNSGSLRDAAAGCGACAYLTDDPSEIEPAWLGDVQTLGVTAGASSPEALVKSILARVKMIEPAFSVENFGEPEPDIVFLEPPELRHYQPMKELIDANY